MRLACAQDEDRGHRGASEQRDRKADVVGDRVEAAGEHEENRESRLRDDGRGRGLELRVHSRGALEEHAVARHRKVDARAGERPGVHTGGETDERHHGHDVARPLPEQPIGHHVEHAALRGGELADRNHVQIQRVEQQVDDDDAGRAENQRPGHVAAGVADLLGHVRRGVPSGVGEHHRNHREHPASDRDGPDRSSQVRRRPRPRRQPEDDEQHECRHLQGREGVAGGAPRSDADDVDEREQDDEGAGGQRVNRERHHDGGERNGDREQRGAIGDARHEPVERDDEEDGAGGDRAAEPGDKRRPPGQETGERSVGFAEVHVLTARFRPQRGEFGVGHGAHERQHASSHPGEQEPDGIRDGRGDRG